MAEHKKYYVRSIEQIKKALIENHGIVYDAAKALGMAEQGLNARIRNHPELQKVRDEAREMEVDVLHSKMHELAMSGEYKALEFLLRTLGRNLGFGESKDINLNGNMSVNANVNLSVLSTEELKVLDELISKSTTLENSN
jgi:hypothetical protein